MTGELAATREAVLALQHAQTRELADSRTAQNAQLADFSAKIQAVQADTLAQTLQTLAKQGREEQALIQTTMQNATTQLSASVEALAKNVDARLAEISGKVSERLDEGFKKTNETFANVMARLATIDEAQKKIDGLSSNVLTLQELLGDKRSRGAFGEVQLEGLVRNIMPPDAYSFQTTLSNGNRADCLLVLPEPTGRVAVDSKFPLENYNRMFARDAADGDRTLATRAFKADVKKHVDDIACQVHHRGRNLGRRGDVRAGRSGVRRNPRLPLRSGRIRHEPARVDRLADHADGGAQHRARSHQGRRNAPPGAHHQGRAVQAGQGFCAASTRA